MANRMKSLAEIETRALYGLCSYVDYDGRLVHRKVSQKGKRLKESTKRDGSFDDGQYCSADEQDAVRTAFGS